MQVYQDKVYDLLNSESCDELFVREHPKKGEDLKLVFDYIPKRHFAFDSLQ